MKLKIPTAQNESELLATLQNVDISVPLRTEGRETDHAEKWSACRLLATLANQKLLQFPLSVLHRDKPDFVLYAGNCEIGMEITEAIPKEYAEYAAFAEREFPDVFLQPGHFRWGCKKMSVTRMRQLLTEQRLSFPPWEGDSAEIEWAAFMAASIRSKIVKLSQQHFLKLQQNWLVIYNNLPLPHVDLQGAVVFLRKEIQDIWKAEPSYDAIFIEHGPVIVKITLTGCINLVLCDLWNNR